MDLWSITEVLFAINSPWTSGHLILWSPNNIGEHSCLVHVVIPVGH
jgi:hypothetical protein